MTTVRDGCCVVIGADELVGMALHALDEAALDVCLADLTPDQRHHILGHLTAARGPLLTKPVRPADWSGS